LPCGSAAVHAMHDGNSADNPHIPAWLVFDQRYRDRYVFAGLPPRRPLPRHWYAAGAVYRAPDLGKLAAAIGVEPDGLVLQPHLVIFLALLLVVAVACAVLVTLVRERVVLRLPRLVLPRTRTKALLRVLRWLTVIPGLRQSVFPPHPKGIDCLQIPDALRTPLDVQA
jgi:hypothetical protein